MKKATAAYANHLICWRPVCVGASVANPHRREGEKHGRQGDECADVGENIEDACRNMEAVLPGGMTLRGHDQIHEVVRAFWEVSGGKDRG
jgi:hypothetical protein